LVPMIPVVDSANTTNLLLGLVSKEMC
jgi:hypothetical protein